MSEPQTQRPTKRLIKEFIKKLLTGKTLAKNRVAISRILPTQEEELPQILIYSTEEPVSRFNEAPKDYRRVPRILIEFAANGDFDDELDLILEEEAEKIEALMEDNQTMNGLVDRFDLTNVAYASSSEGSLPMASVVLTYDVVYYEDALRPKCLDALLGADVKWEVGPEKEITANDDYAFEQGE